MGLFTKNAPPVQPPTPRTRTIPLLWPDYYASIHERLVANGGSDSPDEIAYGVGNAIFKTGMKALSSGAWGQAAIRDFETLYGDRPADDKLASDHMIDYLVTFNPAWQAGEGGWLGTLLGRLDDVLSRPA
jgi:hypothetical protein